MTKYCTDAAMSRKQRVFVRLEEEHGLLAFPRPTDAIRPAGDATMNQVPTYKDSSEKFDTLDLLDQFPNATPPGEWSVPMYIRLSGFGDPPQGQALYEATLGKQGDPFTGLLDKDTVATATALPVKEIKGDVPPVGVIRLGTELIRYGRYDKDLATFRDCVRGYDDTTPADHEAGASVIMLSRLYKMDVCQPTLSVWIESDHLIQFMSGCVVESMNIPVANEDGVLVTFKGSGMRMGWAGTSTLSGQAAEGATSFKITDPKRFTVGARILNRTKNDFGEEGYEILEINPRTGIAVITDGFGGGIAMQWDAGDELTGYLPPASITGDAVEARDTVIVIGGVEGRVKSTELVVSVPKDWDTLREVGSEFPEEFAPTARSITTNVDCVLRRSAVDKLYDGYNGEETTELITMGRVPGKKVSFYMPRVKASVPTIQFGGAAVGMQIPATALGMVTPDQVGENSLCIVFE